MDIEERRLKELVDETLERNVGVSVDEQEDRTDIYIVPETDEFLQLGDTADRLVDEFGIENYQVKMDYDVGAKEYQISIFK